MVRALICSSLLVILACSSAPVVPPTKANPNLLDQKLLSDVVATAFDRIDGLDLRRHVNGKNVAVQVATTYPTETSMIRAQAALLLARAGAVRADLHRGGDLVALIVLRAYGTQKADADDGVQQRGFLIGDLILHRPGSGEVHREALASKAVDHYFSDGTRERRNIGRRASEDRQPEPQPEPRAEPEPEPEPEPVADEPPMRAEPRRARRKQPRERKRAPERKSTSRRVKKKKKAKEEAKEEAKEAPPRSRERRTRRRRRRQPLILE